MGFLQCHYWSTLLSSTLPLSFLSFSLFTFFIPVIHLSHTHTHTHTHSDVHRYLHLDRQNFPTFQFLVCYFVITYLQKTYWYVWGIIHVWNIITCSGHYCFPTFLLLRNDPANNIVQECVVPFSDPAAMATIDWSRSGYLFEVGLIRSFPRYF